MPNPAATAKIDSIPRTIGALLNISNNVRHPLNYPTLQSPTKLYQHNSNANWGTKPIEKYNKISPNYLLYACLQTVCVKEF